MSSVPPITRPTEITSTHDCASAEAFFLKGEHVDAWFERHSDILIVSFYNLATVGEHELPHPWFYGNVKKHGYSVLGLIAHRKDWYRNEDTPRILTELREAGLFEGFRRIVFIGASMGGFAALTYAKLVPGAAVLTFSPQSTLAPRIVPFDKRYKGAQRRYDWKSRDFRDAAGSFDTASDVTIIYDPFVPEDKAHAARLTGDNVTQLRAPFMGHQAIRMLKSIGALPIIFKRVAENQFDPAEYHRLIRPRRSQLKWLREIFGVSVKAGHLKLTLAAARRLKPDDPRITRYLNRLRKNIRTKLAENADRVQQIDHPQLTPPFKGHIEFLNDAYVVPQHADSPPGQFGVLNRNKDWVKLSTAWLQENLTTSCPPLDQSAEVQELAGTHLFAGHFRGHFGHFLFESTARLWALDHLEQNPASILYIPFGTAKPGQHNLIKNYSEFYNLLGIDIPVQSFGSSLKVERLIVPELGFGWGKRYGGSPAYRDFIRSRLRSVADNAGSEKLYISRSKLTSQRGGVIGEEVIERNLASLGYEIFHPQRHSISEQLAKYKSARHIVALDGSALHLVPFVLQPGSDVTVIKRRSTANVGDYDQQFRGFCGMRIKVIDALSTNWSSNRRGRVDFRSIGELDFANLFEGLKVFGFVPKEFTPDLPSETEHAKMVETAIQSRDGNLSVVGT